MKQNILILHEKCKNQSNKEYKAKGDPTKMALKLKYFSPRDHRYSKIHQEAREYISTNTKQRLISLAPEFATYTGNTTPEWENYLSTLACKYEIFGLYANAYHDLRDLKETGKMSRLLIYERKLQTVSEILSMLSI